MKKSLVLLFVVSACTAYAASTCETRVDSHQTATTRERVEYCLSEEKVSPEEVSGPELIYSGTYSKEPTVKAQPKSTVKDGYFKGNQVSVRHQYVGSSAFPAFDNEEPGEEERAEIDQAYDEEMIGEEQTLDPEDLKRLQSERAPSRLDEPAPEQKVSVSPTQVAAEEARGLKARQEKPKRFMKQAAGAYDYPDDDPVSPAPQPQPRPQYNAPAPAQTGVPQTAPSAQDDDDDLLNDELGLDDDLSLPAPVGQ